MRWALFVVLLLPTAHAMEVEIDKMPLLDAAKASEMVIEVQMSCDELLREGLQQENLLLEYTISSTRIDLEGPTSMLVDKTPCLTGVTNMVYIVKVGLTPAWEQPALEPIDIYVTATHGSLSAYQTTVAQVAWAANVTAEPRYELRAGEPQSTIQFPIEVFNDGNGPVRIDWEPLSRDLQGHIIIPEPLVIEAGESKVGVVTYVAPFKNGDNDVEEPFEMRLLPGYAYDPTLKGEPIDLQLQADTKGFYAPGPGSVLLLVGLLASVAVARRL